MSTVSDESNKELENQYNAAFDEIAPAAKEQSDNDAFGIDPPEQAVAAAAAEEGAQAGGEAPEAGEPAAGEPTATGQNDKNEEATEGGEPVAAAASQAAFLMSVNIQSRPSDGRGSGSGRGSGASRDRTSSRPDIPRQPPRRAGRGRRVGGVFGAGGADGVR